MYPAMYSRYQDPGSLTAHTRLRVALCSPPRLVAPTPTPPACSLLAPTVESTSSMTPFTTSLPPPSFYHFYRSTTVMANGVFSHAVGLSTLNREA